MVTITACSFNTRERERGNANTIERDYMFICLNSKGIGESSEHLLDTLQLRLAQHPMHVTQIKRAAHVRNIEIDLFVEYTCIAG